jgi:hypothetical protein
MGSRFGAPPPPDHYDYEWSQTAADPFDVPADGRMVSYMPSRARYYAIGGWNSEGGGQFPGPVNTTNEVWSSADLSAWAKDLPFNNDPPTSGPGARFKRRHYQGQVVHTHAGTEYLYVIGGDHECSADPAFASTGGYQRDVWRSSDPSNANAWELIGSLPGSRMLDIIGASAGKLWRVGGSNAVLGGSDHYDDLHVSTDGGATWDAVSMTNKPPARCAVSELVKHDGRMWLIGGGTYHAVLTSRTYFRDVWSFDPENTAAGWTQHAEPPWLGQMYQVVKAFNGRIWTLGGIAYPNGSNTRVVFSSADGETWRREATGPWPHSHADSAAVNGATLAFVSGNGGIVEGVSSVYAMTATPVADATVLTPPIYRGRSTNVTLSGSDVLTVPAVEGTGNLVPNALGDAVLNAAETRFGPGIPSLVTNGGHFLHTDFSLNQAGFTIIMVGLITDVAAGFFYFIYSTLTGQNYTYFGANRNTGIADRSTYEFDVRRAAVSTVGTENVAYDPSDVPHVYVFHFDGTNEGSFMMVDGAIVHPDDGVVTGDSGTAPYAVPLYIMSDNGGTGSKAAAIVDVQAFSPPLPMEQIRARIREAQATYALGPV